LPYVIPTKRWIFKTNQKLYIMTTKFLNCTPHKINLNDGRSFEPVLTTPIRVSAQFGDINGDICSQSFGDIVGLPPQKQGTLLIVSAMVLSAVKSIGRTDCVAPATGHPKTIRNEKGHIVSVPCFVR
tara:strand:+ start:462 stop:842 length:381 start_codon:yes stop_codon:yes gene_type:complete